MYLTLKHYTTLENLPETNTPAYPLHLHATKKFYDIYLTRKHYAMLKKPVRDKLYSLSSPQFYNIYLTML
jgi:hypothetical protein